MAVRSIEPVELVGCACDGYGQVDRLIESRMSAVDAVAVDACVIERGGDWLDDAVRRARSRGIEVVPLDSHRDSQKSEHTSDHLLVATADPQQAQALDEAWLGVALPGAGSAVMQVAMAQSCGDDAPDAVADILDELVCMTRS